VHGKSGVVPALIAAAGEHASRRFLEFFAANIRNPHTHRAYGCAVARFIAWYEDNRVLSIAAVQPLHVAARIEMQTREHAAPTAQAAPDRVALAGDRPSDTDESGRIGAPPLACSDDGQDARFWQRRKSAL
jgi:hypothetical protein